MSSSAQDASPAPSTEAARVGPCERLLSIRLNGLFSAETESGERSYERVFVMQPTQHRLSVHGKALAEMPGLLVLDRAWHGPVDPERQARATCADVSDCYG